MKNLLVCFILLSCIGCCAIFNKNCPCEEVQVTSVDDTILEALNDPVGFDDYVAQNASMFNGSFYDCAQSRIDELTRISNERKDLCDDAHVTGGNAWNQCYAEVEQEVDNSIVFLQDILSVTRGDKQFEQTSFGLLLIFVKTTDPVAYAEIVALIDDIYDAVAAENNCRICV